MDKNKICVNKKLVLLILFTVCLTVLFELTNNILTNVFTKSSKASELNVINEESFIRIISTLDNKIIYDQSIPSGSGYKPYLKRNVKYKICYLNNSEDMEIRNAPLLNRKFLYNYKTNQKYTYILSTYSKSIIKSVMTEPTTELGCWYVIFRDKFLTDNNNLISISFFMNNKPISTNILSPVFAN